MTVSNTSRTAGPYLGTGLVSVFSFAFKVFLTTDVLVQFTTAGGLLSIGTLGTDYSVSLNSDQDDNPGGTVITTVPLASGSTLTIGSQVPLTQGQTLTNPGGFYPEILNNALDKLTILIQQSLTSIAGAIRIPEIGSSAQILPPAAQRANQLLSFDASGNPVVVAPSAGTSTALALLLASAAGAAQIGWIGTGTGAQTRSVSDRLLDSRSAFDWMSPAQIADVRAFTYTLDVTAAVQAAIDWCAPRGIPLYLPYGGYSLLPATAQVGAANYNTALVMRSGMHLIGARGAVLRIANNYSTDASPKELTIFSSVAYIQDFGFDGITFDMNGANNKMSPARPATYNQFNHAAIMFNGPTGYGDDATITNCRFVNTAGVCFIVTQLVAAGTTPPLGKRWKMTGNLFLNGGLDTNDHTSVYGWCEDVLFEGNTCWEDSPPHTVGKTGGATGYEVHGSYQRVQNNFFYNYTLGLYVAPNFTNTTLNTIVTGNVIYCSDYGVLLWRGVALGYKEVSGVIIANNTFYFDNYTYAGQPLYKAAVAYQGQIATIQGAINNVKIADNLATSVSTTLQCQFLHFDSSTTAGNLCSNWSVTGNQTTGMTDSVSVITNAATGMGLLEISRNQFISGTPDALANPPHGIYINAGGAGIKTLVIDENQFIDERGAPQMQYGIYLAAAGLITDLALGNQTYKGLTAANFVNFGTITRQIGDAKTSGTSNVVDGGTVTFNADYVGLVPKSILCTGIVAGDIIAVTAVGANTFTVAIKKWTGGVLTVGTTQAINWMVKF